MLYNVDFNICGAIFLVFFYVFLRSQYTTDIESNKKFRKFIIVIFLTDIMDILTAVTISYADSVPTWINYILNIIYFILAAGCVYSLLVYVRYMINPNGKKSLGDHINNILLITYAILCVSTPFTHLLFWFDENSKYTHGLLYYLLYIMPMYYIVYGFFWVIVSRKKLQKKQIIAYVIFACFSEIGALIQLLFFPYTLLSYYTSAVSAFIVLFTLETPDYQRLLKTMDELEKAKNEAETARRAAEVARDDAEKARSEAQRANRTKSEFLANMSHEIRTPMNGVMSLTRIAMDKNEDERINTYLEGVYDSGNNLLAIINDILDISKIESGKMDIVDVKYKMSSLINSVDNMLSLKAKEKGLKLHINVSEGMPSCLFGDEVRLRQIMTNLLNNAIKYTKQGEIWFDVNYELLEDEKIKLIVSVKDTGIGIKEEDLSNLFESFQRVDLVSNRNIEGTGLGLRITKQLACMMGGDVFVESEYGKGSTFAASVIHTILDATPAQPGSMETSSDCKEKSEKPSFPEKRVLVVDDVEMNIVVMNALLGDLGLIVDTAMSGMECLSLVKDKKYDLIFMDHMMPKMDGIETFEEMKSYGDYINRDTPVVMLTANAISGVEEEYMQYGFADYISKPVEPEKLYKVMIKELS